MDTRTLASPLTGIHDTDQEILLRLDDDSLYTFCIVSKSAQKLCNETFWWRKFVKEFGTDLEESKKNGIVINYKKIYNQLRNLNDTELFFVSAKNGYIDLVKRLNELKRVDLYGLHANEYALHLVSERGHLEVLKYLIDHGGSEDLEGSSRAIQVDYESLLLASGNGHLDVVKYLIEHSWSEDPSGSSRAIHADDDAALQLASRNGHLDVVKYLIEHKADIHANNDYSLRWASEKGHLDVVKYLIEHGANINVLRKLKLSAVLI